MRFDGPQKIHSSSLSPARSPFSLLTISAHRLGALSLSLPPTMAKLQTMRGLQVSWLGGLVGLWGGLRRAASEWGGGEKKNSGADRLPRSLTPAHDAPAAPGYAGHEEKRSLCTPMWAWMARVPAARGFAPVAPACLLP